MWLRCGNKTRRRALDDGPSQTLPNYPPDDLRAELRTYSDVLLPTTTYYYLPTYQYELVSYCLAVIGATVAVIGEPTSTTPLLPATLPA